MHCLLTTQEVRLWVIQLERARWGRRSSERRPKVGYLASVIKQ